MKEHKYCVFSFDNVEVREREFCIVKGGEVLPVEPKAFRVLLFLLRNPRRLITKEELLDAVWNDAAVTENSLSRNIAVLRRLLGDEIREPRYIATVPTVGYRFLCDVEVAEDGLGGVGTTTRGTRLQTMHLSRPRKRRVFKRAYRIRRSKWEITG
jgi:DNA-binding winged helix-turn-helix (wHTH) protein